MICINDYVSHEKPTHGDYAFCIGIDLNAKRLDRLMELLPRMKPVSVSTLMHSPDMDQFCRDMLAMWNAYVNIEIWSNHTDELIHLVNLLDVKIDFVKSA